MQFNLFKGKSKRTKIFTLITAAAVILLLALNMLLCFFGQRNTIFFDMTKEGLFTLSDAMVDECDELFSELGEKKENKKIKITFCTDPDYLIDSNLSNVTYFMSLKLQQKYKDFVEVETVNVKINPTAVSQYKVTSLSKISANNVIISYGDKYRIVTLDTFWLLGSESTYHYNGEYKMATFMKSVTAITQPVAYFVTDHGESYYDENNPDSEMSKSMATFVSLLHERGVSVKTIKLSDPKITEIPEDCALLVINNPRTDFTYDPDRLNELGYVSDTEKLDRYLVKRQGAIVVSKDYRLPLPVLENYLYEWGFKFGSGSVLVDKESSLQDKDGTATNIITPYDTNEGSVANAIYKEFASLSSAPNMVFSDAGSIESAFRESDNDSEAGSAYAARNYWPFFKTSATAQPYLRDEKTGEITTVIDGVQKQYDVAALSIRTETHPYNNTINRSYLFCVNSPTFFTDAQLGEASYANYDVVSALFENILNVDQYASIDLGGQSLNSSSAGGKKLITTAMSKEDFTVQSNKYTGGGTEGTLIVIKENKGITTAHKVAFSIIIGLVPVTVAVLGIMISVKRKYM